VFLTDIGDITSFHQTLKFTVVQAGRGGGHEAESAAQHHDSADGSDGHDRQ